MTHLTNKESRTDSFCADRTVGSNPGYILPNVGLEHEVFPRRHAEGAASIDDPRRCQPSVGSLFTMLSFLWRPILVSALVASLVTCLAGRTANAGDHHKEYRAVQGYVLLPASAPAPATAQLHVITSQVPAPSSQSEAVTASAQATTASAQSPSKALPQVTASTQSVPQPQLQSIQATVQTVQPQTVHVPIQSVETRMVPVQTVETRMVPVQTAETRMVPVPAQATQSVVPMSFLPTQALQAQVQLNPPVSTGMQLIPTQSFQVPIQTIQQQTVQVPVQAIQVAQVPVQTQTVQIAQVQTANLVAANVPAATISACAPTATAVPATFLIPHHCFGLFRH